MYAVVVATLVTFWLGNMSALAQVAQFCLSKSWYGFCQCPQQLGIACAWLLWAPGVVPHLLPLPVTPLGRCLWCKVNQEVCGLSSSKHHASQRCLKLCVVSRLLPGIMCVRTIALYVLLCAFPCAPVCVAVLHCSMWANFTTVSGWLWPEVLLACVSVTL